MTRSLPARVGAVLFDMDDTLVDSERVWFEAARELWADAGSELVLDQAAQDEMRGGTVADLVERFRAEHPGARPEVVTSDLLARLGRHLGSAARPMPGARVLVERLHGVVPLAISSNSPSDIVRATVEALGWSHVFAGALGTEDVAHPKPAPDLYLAGAAACSARPGDCVVFEDSRTGAAAARAAGAFVVTVGPSAEGLGDAHVDSLEDPLVASWNPVALTTQGGLA